MLIDRDEMDKIWKGIEHSPDNYSNQDEEQEEEDLESKWEKR